MKAITLRPAWAWAVIHGVKRVENRTWATRYRGPLAIHAGVNLRDDTQARDALAEAGVEVPQHVACGAVLGYVDLIDVVPYPSAGDGRGRQGRLFDEGGDPHGLGDDPLASGPLCWIFANPRPLPEPVKANGWLGLWNWEPAD